MKKLLATALLAIAGGLAALPSQAITISFVPSSQDVLLGDSVTVDVFISGLLSDGEIVSAYDLNVLFNNVILGDGPLVVFNEPPMGGPDDAEFSTNFNAGDAGLEAVSFLLDDDLALLQTDDPLLLFTLTFVAVGEGVTSIDFGPDPDFEHNIVGRNALSLDVIFGRACVAVGDQFAGGCNQVPEPTTLPLIALGGMGMALMAFRRKSLRAIR